MAIPLVKPSTALLCIPDVASYHMYYCVCCIIFHAIMCIQNVVLHIICYNIIMYSIHGGCYNTICCITYTSLFTCEMDFLNMVQ